MKKLLVIMILMSCIHSICFSSELNKPFHADEGFTIYLPSDWIQIPQNIIQDTLERVMNGNPNANRPKYSCAFQRTSRTWFQYPYILVQVNSDGQLSSRYLEELSEKIDKSYQNDKSNISQLKTVELIGSTTRDLAYNIFWTKAKLASPENGNLILLSSLLPTRTGYIQINYYAFENDFANYSKLFEEISRGVILVDALKYKYDAPNQIEPASVKRQDDFMSYIAGLIISMIAAFFAWVKKLSKKRESEAITQK